MYQLLLLIGIVGIIQILLLDWVKPLAVKDGNFSQALVAHACDPSYLGG
jgi:hypothetical protein